MRTARNIIVSLVFVILGLLGYIVYLSNLEPIPVRSNWDIKGYSNSIELRWKDPKYSIQADGVVGPSDLLKLTRPSQIILTREGITTPELIDGVESVSVMLNEKIYVIRPSESSVRGFHE